VYHFRDDFIDTKEKQKPSSRKSSESVSKTRDLVETYIQLLTYWKELQNMTKETTKDSRVVLRIESNRKDRWKKLAADRKLSITDLVTLSVERELSTK
jgi:hypothetical protein